MSRQPLFPVLLTLLLFPAPLSAGPAAPALKDADAALKEGERQMALRTASGYTEAVRDFTRAAQDYHALRDRKQEGDALNRAGECCFYTSQEGKALQYYQRALPLRRAAGDRAGEADTLGNLGAVYAITGRPEDAIHSFQQALPLVIAVGDKPGEASTLNALGAFYAGTGQPEKALEAFQRSLPLLKALGEKDGEAAALNNIGFVYGKAGRPNKGLLYLQQALPLYSAAGDKAGKATALANIGDILEATGRPEKALDYFQQCIPLAKAANFKAGLASVLSSIGFVYGRMSQPEKALDYYQQALPLERVTGNKPAEGTTLSDIGVVYARTNQPARALQQYQQALQLRIAAGDKIGAAETFRLAAETLHVLGRNDEARKDYEAALDAADAVIGSITRNDLKRSTTETFQPLYQSYINFLLQQGNRADDRRALEVSEKARSRALRDLLAGNRAQLPSASLALPAGSLTSNTPVLEAAAPSGPTAKTTRAVRKPALRNALDTVALSMPDLPLASTAQAKDFTADEGMLSAVDGPAIVYHPLEKDLAIFVVEPSGEIHVARSPIEPADLNTLIEAAREEITSPGEIDPAETKTTLRKLYDTLIKPAESWLPAPVAGHAATLTIVPFGSLLQLPFAALVAPDGHYLIQKYAIRTTPSLTVLRFTRQRAVSLQKAAMAPLVFGDPVMPHGFTPLPGAMVETKQISAMLTSDHPVLRVREGASEANFRKLAPGATEIHLATHGYVDELQPRLSGVILSSSKGVEPEYERDGYLTVEEVFQLKLNARLVTLSACDTGLGPAGADGVFGLQSAFLTAGAASLLSSLWEVSDTATAKLMTEFYHQMETDPAHNRAKALRSAQLSLLNTPGYQQPEYWAAFQLTGEAR